MASNPESLSTEALEEFVRKYVHILRNRPAPDPVAYLEAWKQRVLGRTVEYELVRESGDYEGYISVTDEYGVYYEYSSDETSKIDLKRNLAERAIEEFVRYIQTDD